MTLFAFITSVEFQHKLLSAQFLLVMNSFNELSIPLSTLWLRVHVHTINGDQINQI